MTPSVSDIVLRPTGPFLYFLTFENLYKAPVKFVAGLFRGGGGMLQRFAILYVEHALARKISTTKKYQRFCRQKVPSIADYVTGC